jgi:hypothetical protein
MVQGKKRCRMRPGWSFFRAALDKKVVHGALPGKGESHLQGGRGHGKDACIVFGIDQSMVRSQQPCHRQRFTFLYCSKNQGAVSYIFNTFYVCTIV